jgi:hypothetical protein
LIVRARHDCSGFVAGSRAANRSAWSRDILDTVEKLPKI